jgi:hypothetical protein
MAEQDNCMLKTALVKGNRRDVHPECRVRRHFRGDAHHSVCGNMHNRRLCGFVRGSKDKTTIFSQACCKGLGSVIPANTMLTLLRAKQHFFRRRLRPNFARKAGDGCVQPEGGQSYAPLLLS